MEGNEVTNNVLKPEESTYQNFITWCETQNIETYSENVFLFYFNEIVKSQNVSTLWKTYLMLKTTFIEKHNLNITEYKKLTLFIQKQNTLYYTSKVHNAFTKKQIFQFLEEAPDDKYLLCKICLMFGVAGACLPSELKNIMTYHIEDTNTILIIKIADAKTEKTRSFVITDKMFSNKNINPISLYRKYLSLRPLHIRHDYFFIVYINNKCTTQPVGIQSMGNISYDIASYLKIEDANKYNRHSFCNTSASLLKGSKSGSIEECLLAETFDDYVDSLDTINQESLNTTSDLDTTAELNEFTDDNNAKLITSNKYERDYQNFITWYKSQNEETYSEDVFLTYFYDKAKSGKHLWTTYTMLKSTFLAKHKINLSKYKRLLTFIKQVSRKYIPKQSKLFTQEEVCEFLEKAPDNKYLLLKVCLIFGIAGACKVKKLKNMMTYHIEDKDTVLIIKIPDTKSGSSRTFTVFEKMFNNNIKPIDIYRRYSSLRPSNISHENFFVSYSNNKCSPRIISMHTIAKIPYKIASYLQIKDAKKYTGLALGKISGTLFADSGLKAEDSEDYIDSSEIIKQETLIYTTENAEDTENYFDSSETIKRDTLINTIENAEDTEDCIDSPETIKQDTLTNTIENSEDCIDCSETIKQDTLTNTTGNANDYRIYIEFPVIIPQTTLYIIPEVKEITNDNNTMSKLVRSKTQNTYEKRYENFITWCKSNNVETYSENAFLTYFEEKAISQKRSTLWSTYSILKSTFIAKHNIDISKYTKLTPFIKQQSLGCTPKKSNVFTREHVCKFLEKAPDDKYLLWKVCLIFGIAGACRSGELKNMMTHHITDVNSVLIIKIPDGKTGKSRSFVVMEKMFSNIKPIELYRKYLSLRPSHIRHDNFFIFYCNNKCSIQPIGVHTIEKIPTKIASYLKLKDAHNYTGHAFRRSSASLLAETDSGIGASLKTEDSEDYIDSELIKQEPLDTSDAEIEIDSPVISKHETLDTTEENEITDDNNAMSKLLPLKSQIDYDRKYQHFITWCKNRNVETYSENVFLSYFKEKTKSQSPSTLWCTYSMLKTSFIAKHNIDISAYTRLAPFLKKPSLDYAPKQTSAFTLDQVCEFLEEAPDYKYLMWKVCLIFGIGGACNVAELKNMMIYHIQDIGSALIVKVPHEKAKKSRTFIIREKMFENIKPIDLYRKYLSLRPSHIDHYNFFIYYGDNKCSTQPVGIHTIGKIPNNIASYLKIGDTSSYSGQTFRKSSATLMADSGLALAAAF